MKTRRCKSNGNPVSLKHIGKNHKRESGIRYLITEECPIGEDSSLLPVKYLRAFKNLDAVTGYIGIRSAFGKRNSKTIFYVAKALQQGKSRYKVLEILPQIYEMG